MHTTHARHQLGIVREHLGDLAAAIRCPPAPVWPPRQLSAHLRAVADQQARTERLERGGIALVDKRAPLNLDAYDAYETVREQLLDLADQVAAEVQHGRGDDPRLWQWQQSHPQGAHWAAVYVDGRLAGEDLGDGFTGMPDWLIAVCSQVADDCARRTLTVLGLDDRHTVIPDRGCPSCGQELTLHTSPDGPPTVTCPAGPHCHATAPVDPRTGRRVWNWAQLPALLYALNQQETAA